MKTCPHCNQEVQNSLTICSHCGADLTTQDNSAKKESTESVNSIATTQTTTAQTLLYQENELDFKKLAIQPLYQYFDFKGRATRTEFWGFTLFSWIINFIGGFFLGILGALTHLSIFGIISWLISLFFIIPGITVSVRRLHDIGYSGWYLILPSALCVLIITGSILLNTINVGLGIGLLSGGLIGTFMISIYLIVLFCLDSDKDTNKYGPSEKYTRV